MYAGGAFTTIGGAPRNGIAALDQNQGDATSWNPNVTRPGLLARRLRHDRLRRRPAQQGERHHRAGTTPPPSTRPTGNATSFGTVVGGTVWAVGASGANVGIGGEFRTAGAGGATAGPVPRSNLAAIDLTTGKATDWNPGANDTVWALEVSGTTLYAGGAFTKMNTTDRLRLAAFQTADGTLTTWNPGVHDHAVLALTVVGSTVYAGGTFTSVSNPATARNFAAAFQVSGAGDLTTWNPNPNASIAALDAIGSTVYLGGSFTSLTPTPATPLIQYNRNRLAAVSASGIGIPTNWNPNLDDAVFALTHVGTTLYAGGAFTKVNGTTSRGGGAAFPATGTATATPWDPQTVLGTEPGLVFSLAASGSEMYVGGIFDSAGGLLSPSVTAVSLTLGVSNASWAPVADGNVYALALAPQGLVMGGSFTATGFPPAGSANNANEPAAAYRGGFALVRALPDAPASVTATPGDGTATVTWQPPAYTGGGPVTSYALVVDQQARVIPDVTSPATVTGLTNGTAYTFSVIAFTSAGFGEANASAPVTPQPVPGAPTGVTVTPGDGQVSVAFTAPAPNGGPAITGYTVTAPPGNIHVDGTTSPITVGGLTNGQAYTFTVTATNAIGTSAASVDVEPRHAAHRSGCADRHRRDRRRHAGHGRVHRAGRQRRPDHRLRRHAVAVGHTRARHLEPDHRDRPHERPGVHVHRHGDERRRVRHAVVHVHRHGDQRRRPGRRRRASNAVTPGSPPTAPGAPTGAFATAGNGQAMVSFTAPASNGGSPITGYTVTSSPGNIAVPGATSPITVPGLVNGQSYTFTVTAKNTIGTGAPSAPSNAVTPTTGATAPGPPTGVTATAGNGQATVAFTAPSSDGGSAITGYTVTSTPGDVHVDGAASPITVTGLTNGQSYTFKVTATNIIGTSQPSGASSAVTPAFVAVAPGRPTGVAATAGNGYAVVTFTPPISDGGAAITDYTVTSSSGNLTGHGSGSGIVVAGLTNGVSYTFTVTATNAAGTSPSSAPSTPIAPSQPARQAPPAAPAAASRAAVPAAPPAGSRPPLPAH